MRVAAAVFVKTPGYSPLKTRLARDIGEQAALEFHTLAAECVAEVLERTDCAPYWAVAEPEAYERGVWARRGFGSILQGKGGLGARLDQVYRSLLAGADAVLLLGADCPALAPEDIGGAIERLKRTEAFVLGPARDGGFYLFGGRREVPSGIWLGTPYSSADTGRRLMELLSPLAPVVLLEERSDVDEREDLESLGAALGRLADPVPAQKRLLSWLESRFSS